MLTKKQKDVLDAKDNYISKNGFSSTVREVCTILNLSSPSTIHDYLKKLKDKGYISISAHERNPRTIKIIKRE